ncbi:uncharacterized protein METZ01_LOCUS267739, partial [marine metagenome]
MVTLREIFDEDLEDIYCFLSENFNPGVTLDVWRLAFNRSWMPEKPNNGFMLLVNNTIVGVLCALYAQRQTQGGIRNVCNTTTWFVLDAYRSHSLKLMIAILGQKGFFFTSLSASPEVYELHRHLKFRSYVTTLVAIPNLPKLNYFSKKLEILADPESISRYLDSHIKQISIDHMNLATVHQVVFRTSDETLLVIFDICTVRGLRATNILYLSNPDMFYQNQNEICSYFLLHNYTLFTRIHRCSMSKVPAFSLEIKRNITLFYNGDIT